MAKNLPRLVLGDQIRLKQILVNLTKNALKFSHTKNICIKAAYHNSEGKLVIHVQDEGKGIQKSE